jgi:hypothetical protein
MNAGEREIVGKKEGGEKGSARGSVYWSGYDATALDIEVDPQRTSWAAQLVNFCLFPKRPKRPKTRKAIKRTKQDKQQNRHDRDTTVMG